jgi:ABC-type transport system involved in multi-copper enzyme maturation permease subunit
MRLLGIEIRRALARRLTKFVFLFALAGILAAGLSVFFVSQRKTIHTSPSGPKIAAFVDACTRGEPLPIELPATFPSVGASERAAACQQFVEQAAGETIDKRFHFRQIMDIIKHVSAMGAILAWLLGASLIGAEWRTGSITTLLTWEPRRTRVIVAKAIAAVLVGFVMVMVLQALLVGALFPAALYHGSIAGTTADFWRSFSYLGLRSGALAAAATLIGFAVASLGRNTAASLGAGFFYLAVIEGAIVGNFIPKARPWLIVRNAVIFINNARVADVGSRTPEQAALLLLGYAIGAFLIAALVMRKRDVT